MYWVLGTLADWPVEDNEDEPSGVRSRATVRQAIVRDSGIAIDYEDQYSTRGVSSVTLEWKTDSTLTGRYEGGSLPADHEVGTVAGECYENERGYFLLGSWDGESGRYIWIVRLVKRDDDANASPEER